MKNKQKLRKWAESGCKVGDGGDDDDGDDDDAGDDDDVDVPAPYIRAHPI